MLRHRLLNNESFWKILDYLEKCDEDYVQIEELLENADVKEEKLLEFISLANTFNFHLKIEKTLSGVRLLKLPHPMPNIVMNLNLTQWIGIQIYLPKIANIFKQGPESLFKTLEEKLRETNILQPQYSYFDIVERAREKQKMYLKIGHQKSLLLEKIEDSINNNFCLLIKLKQKTQIELYIHQVVFLDGGLSLVAEDVDEKCLIYFNLDNIDEIKLSFNDGYHPTYTALEINDFISSIRSVIGREERLVLKIKDQEKVMLSPAYQFLGNPFITSNTNGEIIWAASVEKSDQLFNWLDEIYDYVEILDPQTLVEEYNQYRDQNILGGKKAA